MSLYRCDASGEILNLKGYTMNLMEMTVEGYLKTYGAFEIELCPNCKGSGHVADSEVICTYHTCDTCNGSGRVIKRHMEITHYEPYEVKK